MVTTIVPSRELLELFIRPLSQAKVEYTVRSHRDGSYTVTADNNTKPRTKENAMHNLYVSLDSLVRGDKFVFANETPNAERHKIILGESNVVNGVPIYWYTDADGNRNWSNNDAVIRVQN